MWLPKARQTTRSREEEVKHARQTLLMFEQMLEMARNMGDERMLDMARELIIDQRRSLDVLVADQQQALARAEARRQAAALTAPAPAPAPAAEEPAAAAPVRRSKRNPPRAQPY